MLNTSVHSYDVLMRPKIDDHVTEKHEGNVNGQNVKHIITF